MIFNGFMYFSFETCAVRRMVRARKHYKSRYPADKSSCVQGTFPARGRMGSALRIKGRSGIDERAANKMQARQEAPQIARWLV
ncbi:hypothetical protein GCM10010985_20380 [Caballeronia grimmiae]|uniref:Uncharacterized protein n=1 Tax=Caballeronia grimmiae TaxID=1071679 RepID=A0ABQ1RGU9_9BURK|nr:hypothetical protein GCM10010985_20380 [Caballeronia grimmiae]